MTEQPDNVRARSCRRAQHAAPGTRQPELPGESCEKKHAGNSTPAACLAWKTWRLGHGHKFLPSSPPGPPRGGGGGTWQGAALRGPRREGSLPAPLQAPSPARRPPQGLGKSRKFPPRSHRSSTESYRRGEATARRGPPAVLSSPLPAAARREGRPRSPLPPPGSPAAAHAGGPSPFPAAPGPP